MSVILLWLGLAITLALLGMWVFALINAATFPRLVRPLGSAAEQPALSVLIPARNEARVIQSAVASLLAQDYPAFDLHILDDHSSDNTADLARSAGGNDPRLHIHQGADLPPGWLGKNWACHQLAEHSTGTLLLFTDADVTWQPGALAAVVAEAQRSNADLLTVWPTQITESWGERLIVPLMTLVVMGYLPLPLVHHTPWRIFAAANGQGLLFRREAYHKFDGHRAVRNQVLEDVSLSRKVKFAGLRLRMVDGGELVQCRMYRDWRETVDGYAKNILAGYGNSVAALILATLFHWAVFLWPWIWLMGSWGPAWPGWPLGLITAGLGIRAFTAARMHQRPGDALLMPISVTIMTGIATKAIWWHIRHGGPIWKGRVVRA